MESTDFHQRTPSSVPSKSGTATPQPPGRAAMLNDCQSRHVRSDVSRQLPEVCADDDARQRREPRGNTELLEHRPCWRRTVIAQLLRGSAKPRQQRSNRRVLVTPDLRRGAEADDCRVSILGAGAHRVPLVLVGRSIHGVDIAYHRPRWTRQIRPMVDGSNPANRSRTADRVASSPASVLQVGL